MRTSSHWTDQCSYQRYDAINLRCNFEKLTTGSAGDQKTKIKKEETKKIK